MSGTGSVHHSGAVESALLGGLHLVYAAAVVVGLFGIACAVRQRKASADTTR